MITNQKGFALAICLALLPCLIAGLLLTFSSLGFMQNDLALKYQCRSEGLAGQKKVAPLLTKLLALNTFAKMLKAQYLHAKIELGLAILSKNALAIRRAVEKIRKITEKRETLDKQQKQLINQSNLTLRLNHAKTAGLIRKTGSQISNILLKTEFIGTPSPFPTLAVRPDSADIAPTYNPVADFEIRQALAHEWQYRTQVRSPFSNFIKGTFLFKKACAVTLTKDNSKWIPKITKGKFSLKSLW